MKKITLDQIKEFINTSIKFDFQSLAAVLINCTFMIAYLYDYNLPSIHLTLGISLIVYSLCILSTVLHLQDPNNKYLSTIWFSTILLGLGFFPAYNVLITGGKKYVVLNLSSALLILAMIVEYYVFIVISVVGMCLACIGYAITAMNMEVLQFKARKVYLLSYLFSYTFLSVSLFMRRNEKRNAKKMDFMKVFGSAIAHEVNSPLASVRMISDTLDMVLQSATVSIKDGKYHVEFDEIDYKMLFDTVNPGLKKASNDAVQIVEMLLSALHKEYRDDKKLNSLAAIANDAVNMSSHIEGLNIKTEIIEDFEVQCNKLLLKHVIHNLIKNSIKHGGVDVEIKIIVNKSNLIVEDDGEGIDQDKINKIFDAFFTSGNGHGIGLAFCKFVLDDINAKIDCESEKGKYARFIIQFHH